MKAALSIVLAGLLVTTPLKQVFAQAAQQEAATVQQDAPPDSSGHRLIGVPSVTDNTSRLWSTPSDRARLNTEFAGASFVQEGGLSTAAQVAIVLGSIVVAGAIVGGVVAAGEDNNPESFKSTHSTLEGVGLGALLAIPVTVAAVILLTLLCIEDDDCQVG